MDKHGKAVLLIGFGAPTVSGDVRPFLNGVLKERPVSPRRYEEVVRQYEHLGGFSPYNEQTLQLVASITEQLKQESIDVPVYVGMRNWKPFLQDVLQQMVRDGVTTIAGIVLSVFRSAVSWDRYLDSVEQ